MRPPFPQLATVILSRSFCQHWSVEFGDVHQHFSSDKYDTTNLTCFDANHVIFCCLNVRCLTEPALRINSRRFYFCLVKRRGFNHSCECWTPRFSKLPIQSTPGNLRQSGNISNLFSTLTLGSLRSFLLRNLRRLMSSHYRPFVAIRYWFLTGPRSQSIDDLSLLWWLCVNSKIGGGICDSAIWDTFSQIWPLFYRSCYLLSESVD